MVGDHAAQPDSFAEAMQRVRRAATLLDPEAEEEAAIEPEPRPILDMPDEEGDGVVWSGSAVHAAAAASELSRATQEWSMPKLAVPHATVRRVRGVHWLSEAAYRLLSLVPAALTAISATGSRVGAAALWLFLIMLVRLRVGLHVLAGVPSAFAKLVLHASAGGLRGAGGGLVAGARAASRAAASGSRRVGHGLAAVLILPLALVARLDLTALLALLFTTSGVIVVLALALRG
jgi:hypothetical protein